VSSRASSLRILLTSRWVGLTLALVAVVVGCILLGRWQWQRTNDILAAERVAAAAPVDVREVSTLGQDLDAEAIGRPVFASGEFRTGGQVLVLHRFSDADVAGAWVLTPLDLADGSTIGVLRGWIPPGIAAPGPPVGRIEVSGILHPGERFYPDAVAEPGTAIAISDAVMSEAWGPRTRDGFIMLADQASPSASTPPSPSTEPSSSIGPEPVDATVQTGDVAFPVQNFFYAFQWWIFALFAIALYARWLWLDLRERGSSVREP
jgi:cytochrome oxidase assembly protein ShyY1